jgi:hypothetical protein
VSEVGSQDQQRLQFNEHGEVREFWSDSESSGSSNESNQPDLSFVPDVERSRTPSSVHSPNVAGARAALGWAKAKVKAKVPNTTSENLRGTRSKVRNGIVRAASTACSKSKVKYIKTKCELKTWWDSVMTIVNDKSMVETQQDIVEMENLQYLLDSMPERTYFQCTIDAVLREKFGIPRLENREANNAAMRHYLTRYIKSHNPTMRRTDMVTHIEAALVRAYLPDPNESILAQIQRGEVYQTLNCDYHGETNMDSEIAARTPGKIRRIWWTVVGTPRKWRKNIKEAEYLKRHNHRFSNLRINNDEVWVPFAFNQVDPLFELTDESEPLMDAAESADTYAETGRGTGINNTAPAGSVTALESA